MREEWRPCFDGYYEASSLGRIRRVKGGKGVCAGRVLKPAKDGSGYLFVFCWKNGHGKIKRVHRLVAEAFLGKSLKQVNHKDLNKQNNRPSNLEYATPVQNMEHARCSGALVGVHDNVGEANPNARLDAEKVLRMRKIYAQGGISYRQLGLQFDVDPSVAWQVVTGRSWGHL